MSSSLQKLRQLILPPRPDPARSRRIAEGRLMIGCLVAFGIFITIGVRIVGLADASASTRLAQSAAAITTERGRILDRKGRLLAWQSANYRSSCRPWRDYGCTRCGCQIGTFFEPA
jgi:cell division protein FtsI/penicillin-binding protein 2